MRYLRQSTATVVEVGPFVDDSDGKTLEEALTVASIDVQFMQPLDTATVPPDLITNGVFGADTDWTTNSWTIAGGVADSAAAQSTSLTQTVSITENKAYELVFDVATQSAGSVQPILGTTSGTSRSTVATFTETIIAGSGSLIDFDATGFTGTIDNVVLKQVPIPITPAASGSTNDMVLTQSNTGTYWLELTANQVGIVGRHKLTAFISGALIVWEEFMVVEEAIFDAFYISGSAAPNTTTPPTAAAIVNEWETQSQADPTGFHVNVLEVSGTAEDLPTATALAVVDSNVDDLVAATIAASGVVETSGSNSSTQVQTNLAEASDDHYDVMTILFTSGAEAGQSRLITGYAGATGTVSWNAALIGTPADDVTFVILAAGTTADAVWDELLTGSTHNINNSAGKRLRALSGAIFTEGTMQAGSTVATAVLASGESSVDQFFDHARIVIIGGTGIGQEAIITDYDGTSKVCIIAPDWRTTPDNTSEYEIVPGVVHSQTNHDGYANESVYVGPSGVTTVRNGIDGTSETPIDDGSFANAVTIANLRGLVKIHFYPGSVVTFPATINNFELLGAGYSIALNSQDISGCRFFNGSLSGIGTGGGAAADRIVCRDCFFPSTITLPLAAVIDTNLDMATITLGDAGTYNILKCQANGATIDYSTPLNQTVNFHQFSGHLTADGMGDAGTDVLFIDGPGGSFTEGTCTSGNLTIAGNFAIAGITNITVSQVARVDNPSINAEVDTGISDAALATAANLAIVDTNVDQLELGIIFGTAATGTLSTTQATSSLTGFTDDQLIGRVIIFTAGPADGEATDILDYASASGLLTFTDLTLAPEDGDAFKIV